MAAEMGRHADAIDGGSSPVDSTTSKAPIGITSLVGTHRDAIRADIDRVYETRRNGPEANIFSALLKASGSETDMAEVLPTLQVVQNPEFILISPRDGRYRTGPITSTHGTLGFQWQCERWDAGEENVDPYENYRTGIGFELKPDPEERRVAVLFTYADEEEGPVASGLANDGYTVFDLSYTRIEVETEPQVGKVDTISAAERMRGETASKGGNEPNRKQTK